MNEWNRTWARRYTPFLATPFVRGFVKNKRFGTVPDKLFVPEGNLMAMYFNRTQHLNLIKNYSRFLHKQNITKYAIYYENQFKSFLNFATKVYKIPVKKLSDLKLAELVRKVYESVAESTDYQYSAFLVLEGDAIELEQRLLKEPNGDKILRSITTPYKETIITKARLELLKLAAAKNKNFSGYSKKYAWIPVYEPLDKPWGEKEYKKQAAEIKFPKQELHSYQVIRRQHLKFYSQYIRSVKDPALKKQIEIVHAFSYLKEMRDDYRRKAYYLFTPLLKEVARRFKVAPEDIAFMMPDEISAVLRGNSKLDRNMLKARRHNYAFVLKRGKLQVFVGAKARALGAKMIKEKQSTEFKGQSAHRGLVKGKVSVIYHQGEFKNFKSGSILVTTMTHPEFLPIMKKAKAIVTDEGGITCHAAIVSRELGIPCIIGTKNATRVLKDGDFVEVDATKGIVRKLK